MSVKRKVAELSKNQKAIAGWTQLAVYFIIFGVAAYADVQFILVMWKAFPDGIAKIFSLIGAVATGASVLALVLAEAFWFSRGPQMTFGWAFTAAEVVVSILNVILSFELSPGEHLDGWIAMWLQLCPATPFVAFVGWIIVLNLDEGQKARHEEREMQDDLAQSEREHAKAVHESRMDLKQRYLESTTTYLEQIASDPRIQKGLEMGAWKFASEELRNLTGMYLPMPQQTIAPQTVDSVAPGQSTQASPHPSETSYSDDLASSVAPPAAAEKSPITENLAPFEVAPVEKIQNGHGATAN